MKTKSQKPSQSQLEELCFKTKQYKEVILLSRKVTSNDVLWRDNLRFDGFASLMLGDIAQAEFCYRKLHDEYKFLIPHVVQQAQEDLRTHAKSKGVDILKWLGVVEPLTDKQMQEHRSWWNNLPMNWQKQFRITLTREMGFEARKASAESTTEVTDLQLRHILDLKYFSLHEEYPLETLKPLLHLPKLTSLKFYTFIKWPCITEVSQFTQLEALSFPDLKESNLNFLKKLTRLKTLEVGSCEGLIDADVLGNMIHLTHLKLDFVVTNIDFVSNLTQLKQLTLLLHDGITNLKGIRQCRQLEDLSLQSYGGSDLADVNDCQELKKLSITHANNLKSLHLSMKPKIDELIISECTQIKSIDLQHFPQLNELDLDFNESLELVSHPNKCKKLTKVSLFNTRIQDISEFADCPELKEFEAYTEEDVKITGLLPLTKCSKLKTVLVSAKTVDKKTRDEFKKKKPNVLSLSPDSI